MHFTAAGEDPLGFFIARLRGELQGGLLLQPKVIRDAKENLILESNREGVEAIADPAE